MDWYDLLVYVHVVGAVVWIGSGAALQAIAVKARNSNSHNEQLRAVHLNEWFSNSVFAPAGMITLLAGFALVGLGWSHIHDVWIIAAIIAIALSFVWLATVMKPITQQLLQAKTKTEDSALLFKKYLWASRLDLILLLFVLYTMVVKPKNLDITLWGGLVAAVLAIMTVSWQSRGSWRK